MFVVKSLKMIIGALRKAIIIFKMPPKKGGKRTKRGKKIRTTVESNRYTPFAERGQMYAIVTKMLGNRRLTANCIDGKERLVHIPGKLKGRRNWISVGMVLLLNIREYQDDKADVIYIYNAHDIKLLRRLNQLGDLLEDEGDDNCGFVFGTDDDTDSGDDKEVDEELDIDAL